MKFTNGYWLLREEIEASYAVEYSSHRIDGDTLILYLPSRHIEERGDALNHALLTVELSSPMSGVIKVSARHFEGVAYKGPFIRIHETNVDVDIREEENVIIYKSGNLEAHIDKRKNAYSLSFMENGVLLTKSDFKNLASMKNKNTGKNYMVEQLLLDVGEYIYGLGERFTPFVKNGQIVEMWNEDGGTASEMTYKNIPFYLSNKGYGVLVSDLSDVAFEIGSEKVERVQFSTEGERIDYYVISGPTPMKAIEKYTDLTGKPALPPAWSFGLWLTTSFTTNYDEETTGSFIQGMKDRNIPLHVFHFDCYWMDGFEWCNFTWDKQTFPNPQEMLARYHEKGLKVCVWINPYIGQKSPLFKEGMENGYLLKKVNGDVWQTDLWQPGMGIVDFTNPRAKVWYQNHLRNLLEMGVDCFKTDFGERIPAKDIIYFDGSDSIKMHNYYTYLYNQAVFEVLEEVRGKNEAVLFARSATVGGQSFPAHWGGDCFASYVSMAETLRGGLSLSLSGFAYWSHDISGFESTATPDLYKRWCQFGLLSTHSRLHGSISYRVPWLFDEEASEILREFTNLKCRLMPYIYGESVKASTLGRPILRPIFLDFPGDRAAEVLDRQYMFGDNLLVAPIFNDKGVAQYYLPQGKWYNLLTGKSYEGGKWFKEEHDYHSLPLMLKPNAILPMSEEKEKVSYDFAKEVKLIFSHFDEEVGATCEIPNERGEIVMVVKACKKSGMIYACIQSEYTDYTLVSVGGDPIEIVEELPYI